MAPRDSLCCQRSDNGGVIVSVRSASPPASLCLPGAASGAAGWLVGCVLVVLGCVFCLFLNLLVFEFVCRFVGLALFGFVVVCLFMVGFVCFQYFYLFVFLRIFCLL